MTLKALALTFALLVAAPAARVVAQDVTAAAQFDAQIGLARVKRDAGDTAAARAHFEAAARLRPLDQGERAEYFWVLVVAAPAEAVPVGRDVLRASPSNDRVRDAVITTAANLGDEPLVLDLASEGRRLMPKDARWPRRLAESYLRRGLAAKAVDAYAAAASISGDVQDQAGLALASEAAGDVLRSGAAWAAVPAAVRDLRPEWKASYLRALAAGQRPEIAALEIEQQLQKAPGDVRLREMLVDLWSRAGQPARALAAIGPLTSTERWRRREVDLARAAGNPERAIQALDRLRADGRNTAADRRSLIELLIETRRFDRAGTMIDAMIPAAATTCDEPLFELIDRLPEPAGTNRMFALARLGAQPCAAKPRWLVRSLERLVAAGRHLDAIAIVDLMRPSLRESAAVRRLHGQLRLWTGDAPRAIDLLEACLRESPGDIVVRQGLVDAYRAVGRPYEAWRVAAPLLDQPSIDADALRTFAAVALEADDPRAVAPILDRLAPDDRIAPRGVSLRARALLALGRPAEAHQTLAAIDPVTLEPDGALALLDSTIAMDGHAAALASARAFTARTVGWKDVVARRALLEAVAGDRAAADDLRAWLASIDPALALIVDIETRLVEERPDDAMAMLMTMPDVEGRERTADLLETALAGVGHLRAAAVVVSRLSANRPRFAAFTIRTAELEWHENPSPATLERMLKLPGAFPGHYDAITATARVLASAARHNEAVALLDRASHEGELPLSARLVAARSYQALGRPADGLALLAETSGLSQAGGVLRAELVAAVHGWTRADEAFRLLAARANAAPEVFLAWAAAAPSPSDRVRVLDVAVARLSDRVDLWSRLASARLATADFDGARVAAERAVQLDPGAAGAWAVLVDATAAMRPHADLDAVLRRFAPHAAASPALVIGTAEHLAGLARDANDPVLARALEWLDSVSSDAEVDARDLARARVLASARRWPEALAAVDRVTARDPRRPQVLLLRAELLSWSGRHAEAVTAYDAYLAVAPLDVTARRQQARVAGWGGYFAEARRRYAALLETVPESQVVAVEAAAKSAFFDLRWREAVRLYSRWVSLEPDNTEARFELAEAERGLGRLEAADATLRALEARPEGHRLASDARRRAATNARPSASLFMDSRAADGYGGQRLLEMREQGGGLTVAWSDDRRTSLALEGAHVGASAAGVTVPGYRAGFGVARRWGLALRADGSVNRWDLGAGRPSTDVSARLAWQLADRWTLAGGAERRPMFETLETVTRGFSAAGAFANVVFQSPATSIDVRVGRHSISDGNMRSRATLSASRAVAERFKGLRVIAWAEQLAYRSASSHYFSPSSYLHADAGVEHTHAFAEPRFLGDRERALTIGYLVGLDSRGTWYQQPVARLSFDLTPDLVLDVRAGRIQSADYHQTTFSMGLRIGGLAPAAMRP